MKAHLEGHSLTRLRTHSQAHGRTEILLSLRKRALMRRKTNQTLEPDRAEVVQHVPKKEKMNKLS